ncbi:unnamed protein product [Diamesa serratosioi]
MFAPTQSYSDSEDEYENHSQGFRCASIFVIDAAKEMFLDEDHKFHRVLAILEGAAMNQIISTSTDLFCVVLYNTEKSPAINSDDDQVSIVVPKNCSIMIPMKPVSADTIRFLKGMQEFDLNDFSNKFGHSEDTKISDVLWLCSSLFSNAGFKLQLSSIFWMTDNDSPHDPGSNNFQQAYRRAKDSQQLNWEFRMIPLKEDFDGDKFYKELICNIIDEDPTEFEFPKFLVDEYELKKRVFRRDYRKRTISKVEMKVGDDMKIGIGIYSIIRKSAMPTKIMLSRDTKQVITATRGYKYGKINDDEDLNTQEEADQKLTAAQTIKYQEVGSEMVKFTPIEANEIKQILEPGLKILGFKPSSVISMHNHIKSPYFVYPTECTIKNSTVFFRALWEKCLELEVVAIGIFTMRLKSLPRLVALIPQEMDEKTMSNDGFRLEFLPFTGDIRNLNVFDRPAPQYKTEAYEPFRKIVKKLKFHYEPELFENPSIRNIYKNIESVEFDTSFEVEEDATLPNEVLQDSQIYQYVAQLSEIFNGLELEPDASKRKATESASTSQPKKQTVEKAEVNEVDLLDKIGKGQLKDVTVTMLKTYLSSLGVSGLSKMTKSVLIETIKNKKGI